MKKITWPLLSPLLLVLLLLLCGRESVICSSIINWQNLNAELKGSNWKLVGEKVAMEWSKRPADLMEKVDEDSWRRLTSILLPVQVSQITVKEFKNAKIETCKLFVKYLPILENVESLCKNFRLAVYDFVKTHNDHQPYHHNQPMSKESASFHFKSKESMSSHLKSKEEGWIEKDGPQSILDLRLEDDLPANDGKKGPPSSNEENSRLLEQVTQAIPIPWIIKDGPLVMEALVSNKASLLGLLKDKVLAVLLSNPKNSCGPITIEALKLLNPKQASFITPSCMASIKGIDKMDLSMLMQDFNDDIFSEYNGPLYKGTIEGLSGEQLKHFASQIDRKEAICTFLELYFVKFQAIQSITANCLHGYLTTNALEGRRRGLGYLWNHIPLETLNDFTPEKRSSWANISLKDFPLMTSSTLQVILNDPDSNACVNLLKAGALGKEIVRAISGSCLHKIIMESSRPFKIGKLWRDIPTNAIASFTSQMMQAIKRISVDDFKYFHPRTLYWIVRSKMALGNLPQPVENIIIPLEFKRFVIGSEEFLTLTKAAPNVAGQILLQMEEPQSDLFANFDGNSIRSLTCNVPGRLSLDFSSLFSKLERVSNSFGKVIESMSNNASIHFCSTIRSFKEYLLMTWLRRNMGESCRSNLRLNLTSIKVLLRAPELVNKNLPWRRMLTEYTLQDWRTISSNSRFATVLGGICEFWMALNDQSYQSVFDVLHRRVLKSISQTCIWQLKWAFDNSPGVIPFLSEEAFSSCSVARLPCKLKELSVAQISKLSQHQSQASNFYFDDHILEELKPLTHEQFKVVLPQLGFVPIEIRLMAINWHFESIMALLNSFLVVDRVENGVTHYGFNKKDSTDENDEWFKNLIKAVECFLTFRANGPTINDTLNWFGLFSAIRNSNKRKEFIEFFSHLPMLKSLALTLAFDADEFHGLLLDAVGKSQIFAPRLFLPFKGGLEAGFDRLSVFELLQTSPAAFAGQWALVLSDNFVDGGGPMRMLVDQILSDIKRDLIEAIPRSSSCRFIWAISSQVGLTVGLALGKAMLLGMRLPFTLDLQFYQLLTNPSNEEAIKNYYLKTYEKEMDEFESSIRNLRNPITGSMREVELILTRLEHLRFTKLSTEASLREAKLDFKSKTNVKGCGADEGFTLIDDGEGLEFLKEYFTLLRGKFLEEFLAFFNGITKGLELTLPPLGEFKVIPPSILDPLAQFFGSLLNGTPISGEDVIKRIVFKGDTNIESFIPNEHMLASKVVSTFILSLNGQLLEHLLAIWTGSSTLFLEYFTLKVDFVTTTITEMVCFDFCSPLPDSAEGEEGVEEVNSKPKTLMIAPGKEYLEFFSLFVKNLWRPINSNGEGDDYKVKRSLKPDCPLNGLPLSPITILTCDCLLLIPLRPAQQLFNNLVDMINTRVGDINDNNL